MYSMGMTEICDLLKEINLKLGSQFFALTFLELIIMENLIPTVVFFLYIVNIFASYCVSHTNYVMHATCNPLLNSMNYSAVEICLLQNNAANQTTKRSIKK